jgi:hypothetical protein
MYYPKSQIKTNLYTNGGEFQIKITQQPYVGYFYQTSNGDIFTGKNPQDGSPQPLEKVFDQSNDIILYNPVGEISYIINPILFPTQNQTEKYFYNPYHSPVLPTDLDKSNGSFTRYFCKKNNENIYIEINQDLYNQLYSKNPQIVWNLYTPYSITWQIKGDQESTLKANKSIVLLTEQRQKWYGFSQYLKEDYLKYYLGE